MTDYEKKEFHVFLDEKVEGISDENKLYFIDSKRLKNKRTKKNEND